MKPFPAIESLQEAQTKHCECQCLPSKEIKRVPPAPENRWLLFNFSAFCLHPATKSEQVFVYFFWLFISYLWLVYCKKYIVLQTVPQNNWHNTVYHFSKQIFVQLEHIHNWCKENILDAMPGKEEEKIMGYEKFWFIALIIVIF